MNTQRYAFFDFDGTLIAKDSFLILLQQACYKQPWRLLFVIPLAPILIATYLFRLDKTLAKSCLLWALTVGHSRKGLVKLLTESFTPLIEPLWFEQVVPIFEQLQKENVKIVVISASGQIWIRALLRKKYRNFTRIIGSRLGFFMGGVILRSKNCYLEEKLNRIREALGEDFIWHSAWSDHIADLPMLKKAELRYLISPKKKHMQKFSEQLNNQFKLYKWEIKS